MDWISASGFAWGYVGSTIPFMLGMLLILKHGFFGMNSNLPAVRITFAITALWWIIFTLPFLKNVEQSYFIQPSARPIRDSLTGISMT